MKLKKLMKKSASLMLAGALSVGMLAGCGSKVASAKEMLSVSKDAAKSVDSANVLIELADPETTLFNITPTGFATTIPELPVASTSISLSDSTIVFRDIATSLSSSTIITFMIKISWYF